MDMADTSTEKRQRNKVSNSYHSVIQNAGSTPCSLDTISDVVAVKEENDVEDSSPQNRQKSKNSVPIRSSVHKTKTLDKVIRYSSLRNAAKNGKLSGITFLNFQFLKLRSVFSCSQCTRTFPCAHTLRYHEKFHVKQSYREKTNSVECEQKCNQLILDSGSASTGNDLESIPSATCQHEDGKTLRTDSSHSSRLHPSSSSVGPFTTCSTGITSTSSPSVLSEFADFTSTLSSTATPCGYSRDQPRRLDRFSLHRHSAKSFKCKVCFSRNQQMSSTSSTATGDKIVYGKGCSITRKGGKFLATKRGKGLSRKGNNKLFSHQRKSSPSPSTNEDISSLLFHCDTCESVFPSRFYLDNHMRVRHQKESLNCEFCGEAFWCPKQLSLHKQIFCCHRNSKHKRKSESSSESRNPKIKCEFCHKRFSCASNLKNHLNQHLEAQQKTIANYFTQRYSQRKRKEKSNELKENTVDQGRRVMRKKSNPTPDQQKKEYNCATCSQTFTQYRKFLEHKKLHPVTHACEKCGKTFKKRAGVERHLSTVHNREKGKFECKACLQVFFYLDEYKAHRKTHVSTGNCETCGKSFNSRSNLARHRKIHLGVKKAKCSVCGKAFVNGDSLKKHLNTHLEHKPFSCEICGRSFTQQGNLKLHRRIHHADEQRPFICDHCGKSFYYKNRLGEHLRLHTGEKPYVCSICSKSFRCHSTYAIHKRVHSGEKPFSCTICGQSFKQRANLRAHKVTHSGEKRYKCDVCGRGFTAAHSVKRHMLTHTGHKPFSCELCGRCFIQKGILKTHMKLVHKLPLSDTNTDPSDAQKSSTESFESQTLSSDALDTQQLSAEPYDNQQCAKEPPDTLKLPKEESLSQTEHSDVQQSSERFEFQDQSEVKSHSYSVQGHQQPFLGGETTHSYFQKDRHQRIMSPSYSEQDKNHK